MNLSRIYLVVNETKPDALRVLVDLKIWCQQRSIEAIPVTDRTPDDADDALVLSLGGDGTVLRAATLFADTAIPILGINLGSLGFLTQASVDDLIGALERVEAGDYTVEERMRLSYAIGEHEQSVLNDVVFTGVTESRFCELQLAWGDGMVSSYVGDGLILSTATGSTAYSLSAGGPVIVPPAACILATPHAVHKLGLRPVIFPADEELRVRAGTALQLIADGDAVSRLAPGSDVLVRRFDRPTRLVRISSAPGFFSVLNRKLNWADCGERIQGS